MNRFERIFLIGGWVVIIATTTLFALLGWKTYTRVTAEPMPSVVADPADDLCRDGRMALDGAADACTHPEHVVEVKEWHDLPIFVCRCPHVAVAGEAL